MQRATFACGCFWGAEDAFVRSGLTLNTTVGYTGGHTLNPTYKDVCTGATGHAEAVEVQYDPDKVHYQQLLNVFWNAHDPTQLNRQGPDIGTQYRSAIYCHQDEQRRLAEADKKAVQSRYNRLVVTEITEAAVFFPAEEYHQKYLQKHKNAYCHISKK